MRVALVCDWFLPRLGGIELHLRDLARALASRGIDARIVTTTPGPSEVDGVAVHRVPVVRMPGTGVALSPTLVGKLRDVLEGERFDLVHTHASVVSPTAYAGLGAAAQLELPAVITFHSMLYRTASALAAAETLLGWSRNVVITAVSSVVAAQLAADMPNASVAILPNGIDVPFWNALPEGKHAEPIEFVTAMRLSRKKRPLELIRAFAETCRFVASAPLLRLTVAGEGPDRSAAERLVAELGVSDKVVFSGHLSRTELRELYARSHVFVLPSERESFGIAAVEARAAALPVVAMMASGARDFITPGINGLLARDHGELARYLARMALEPAMRSAMSVQNRRPPLEYDWSAVTDQHLEIYRAAATLLDADVKASQR